YDGAVNEARAAGLDLSPLADALKAHEALKAAAFLAREENRVVVDRGTFETYKHALVGLQGLQGMLRLIAIRRNTRELPPDVRADLEEFPLAERIARVREVCDDILAHFGAAQQISQATFSEATLQGMGRRVVNAWVSEIGTAPATPAPALWSDASV